MTHQHPRRWHSRAIRRIATRLLDFLRRAIRHVWRTHVELLAGNAAYAAAITAVAAAVATQTTPADLTATVLAGALAIYAALRRRLSER